jgi:chemotaxis protein methyltransferase CheR
VTETLDPALERFADTVISRLGFRVHENNLADIEAVMRRCLERSGCASIDAYLQRFADAAFAQRELREVAVSLTVAETYFFRHPEQFRALVEAAVPQVIDARRRIRQLNVLSAGCATGEEAYSLAAALADLPALHGWQLRITAVDVNAALLEKARAARFSSWSLRSLTAEQRSRYFRREGEKHVLDPRIAAMVRFEPRNLMDPDPAFWLPERFDVVFCRNVMIYFSPDAVRTIVERLTLSLAQGGFLFLGPSETLRGLSQAFHLRHTHGAFYYQRRLAHEAAEPASPAASVARRPASAPAAEPSAHAGWVSAIAASSDRVAALADRSLRRFATGDAPVQASPSEEASDPDELLVQAVLLADRGALQDAEQLCRRLLARDELRPGLHYVLALCEEGRGDYLAAAEQDQTAIYLDPSFAMAHLHLGLIGLRMGDLPGARRALREALTLLAGEDASRILLFGGGFDRAALMRLCETQLARCGRQE